MNKPKIVVEQFLSDLINDIYPSLNNEGAYLYGLENTDTYVSGAATCLDTDKDIYHLIEKDLNKAYTVMYDILAFFTFGWAAPYQPNVDTPPSEHPEKIRVLLTMFSYTDGTIISVLKHCDDPTQSFQFQYTDNQGPLYDTLVKLYT